MYVQKLYSTLLTKPRQAARSEQQLSVRRYLNSTPAFLGHRKEAGVLMGVIYCTTSRCTAVPVALVVCTK